MQKHIQRLRVQKKLESQQPEALRNLRMNLSSQKEEKVKKIELDTALKQA